MKITAIGSQRSRVGNHHILETKSGKFDPDIGGFVSFIGKTEKLALSGHFDIEIQFSPKDIDALYAASEKGLLKTKIGELEKEIRKLKNSN